MKVVNLPEGYHVEERVAYDPDPYTKAGPVTVRKADGSTVVQDAYDRDQFDKIVRKKRHPRRRVVQ